MDAKDVIEFLKNDRFAVLTGIEVIEVKDNYAKTKLSIEQKHLNANNVVMGGCIYTLADYTFALASNAGNNPTSTLTSNITFNSPATGKELFAETEIIKNGRSICDLMIKITDENDRLIATVTSLGFRKA